MRSAHGLGSELRQRTLEAARPTVILMAVLCSGCNSFGFDVRSFRLPVMVSPMLRVDDRGPAALSAPIARVHGEASTSASSGAGSHDEERGGQTYRVDQSAYGSSRVDNVFASLADSCGGRYDVFVVIDELTVRSLVHMSMIGHFAMELEVEGRVHNSASLRREPSKSESDTIDKGGSP